MDELGRAVNRNPLKPWKPLSSKAANRAKIIGWHSNRITGRQKQGSDLVTIDSACFDQVGFDIGNRANFKARCLFIRHAKGASIMRASDSGLDQKRAGFTGRAVYGTFIAHTFHYQFKMLCHHDLGRLQTLPPRKAGQGILSVRYETVWIRWLTASSQYFPLFFLVQVGKGRGLQKLAGLCFRLVDINFSDFSLYLR